ncbi:hypothetical protein LZ30DRAFT_690051 [Colletotrichum cereale]|nr:hypothetical protein LZ30DRAFT_690051 [Colletotrichum cereale]
MMFAFPVILICLIAGPIVTALDTYLSAATAVAGAAHAHAHVYINERSEMRLKSHSQMMHVGVTSPAQVTPVSLSSIRADFPRRHVPWYLKALSPRYLPANLPTYQEDITLESNSALVGRMPCHAAAVALSPGSPELNLATSSVSRPTHD